jgi:kynurenine formamidase
MPRSTLLNSVQSLLLVVAAGMAMTLHAQPEVGTSPWGPDDELGRMNLNSDSARAAVLSRVGGGKVYDLSVEYFVGMPSWSALEDPRYQFWLTHTPRGTVVDDPMSVGATENRHVSYTGSAFSMYSHMGTHIDALNHFGLNGRIYNGFAADEHLGDRGWRRSGAETIPPLVARGVLLDVAGYKQLPMLADNYRITRADLVGTLRAQGTELQAGDVVLVRTGRMQLYENAAAYIDKAPGLGLDAARFLVEEGGAMIVGADNLSFEAFPSEVSDNYVAVHTYLLAQHGVPIIELAYLDELARDRMYEFAFIGAALKLRGADAAPLRPLALPLTGSQGEAAR